MPAARHRGFTLIEVLVAMVIMAIMSLMAWQGVDGIVRARDSNQVRLEQTLRLETVIAQWEQDLASLQETTRGADAHLRRPERAPHPPHRGRHAGGRLVAAPRQQRNAMWQRWAGPPVTTTTALQETWLRTQQFQGSETGQLKALTGLDQWQVYFFQGNAWANCQSTGDVVRRTPASGRRAAPGAAERRAPGPRLRARQRPQRQPGARHPARAMTRAAALASECARVAQRGAALLTAMIIVALVATLASSMVWQQWRAIQVEAAERARTQSAWVLSGALDWARLILREDAKTGGTDHLGEPWAVPLAEARLSTFLAADKDNTEDAPDAFLSGSITDANARYNLTNVVKGGKIDPIELAALQRLCETVGLSVDVATRIATGLRDASPPPPPDPSASGASAVAATPPPANPPLMPRSAAQLAWLGIEPGAVQTLEPYVVILPEATFVNVNTAPREVLVAAVEGLDLATAERIVQSRQRVPIKSPADLKALAPSLPDASLDRIAIGSNFFEVRGRLRLGDVVLEQRSLVQRRGVAGRGAAARAGLRARRHGLVSQCKSAQQYCEGAATEQRKSLIAGVFDPPAS